MPQSRVQFAVIPLIPWAKLEKVLSRRLDWTPPDHHYLLVKKSNMVNEGNESNE